MTSSEGNGTTPGPGFVPPTPEELDNLLSSFDVTERIGMGGMGAVYLGLQKRLERPVAIKVMPAHIGLEYDFPARFEREAKAMAQLSHNNIVGVLDYGELTREDGTELLYFIMEYVQGSDLHKLIRTGLKPAEAYSIISQICDALDYAHENGIIHRDIKPANILIDKTGKVKVADFGLAKVAAGPGATSAVSSVALGTPDYAAPEVFELDGTADYRADIYSLGVLIYEALTGRVPRGRFLPPSQLNPELNARLDQVVEKAMAQDKDQRFQKASEVSMALTDAKKGPKLVMGSSPKSANARHQPVAARPGSADPPLAAQPVPRDNAPGTHGKSSKAMIWGIAGGAIALVVALIAILASGNPTNDQDSGSSENGGVEKPTVSDPNEPTTPPTGSDKPDTPDQPAEPPTPPDKPNPPTISVDLLEYVDTNKSEPIEEINDAIRVKDIAGMLVDYDPNEVTGEDGYIIDLVVTAKTPNGFRFSLPVAGRRIVMPIDFSIPEIPEDKRLVELFHKFEGTENPTRAEYSEADLKVGSEKAHRIVISVSPKKIATEIDGEKILEWEGEIEDLEFEWGPEVDGTSARGKPLLEFFGDYAVHRMELLPFEQETTSVDLAEYEFPALSDKDSTESDPSSGGGDDDIKPDDSTPNPPASPNQDDQIAVRLAELGASFETKLAEDVENLHTEGLRTLNSQFTGALDRAKEAASSAGKLDDVLAIQKETERITAGEGVPEVDEDGTPGSLVELRKTYREQVAKLEMEREERTKPLFDIYLKALSDYEAELTKAKDIAGALRVREHRIEVEKRDSGESAQ